MRNFLILPYKSRRMDINDLILSVIASSIEFVLCLICSIKLWRHRKEGDRSRLILAACSFLCVIASLIKFSDLIIYDIHYQYSEMHSPYIINVGIFCQLALLCYPLEMMRPGWFRWRNILILFSPWIVLTLIQVSGILQFRSIHAASEMITYAYEPNVMLRWIAIVVYLLCGFVLLLIPYNFKDSSVNRNWMMHWVGMVALMPMFFVAYQFTRIIFFHCCHQILIGLFFLFFTRYEVKNRLLPPQENDESPDTDMTTPLEKIPTPSKNGGSKLWTRIIIVMETNGLWKDSDLNLNVLSRLVYSNRTYVTKAFKENSNMTFAEYLKRKRIDYVANKLEKKPSQNIKNLFFDAGYRSYPTAWRHFKEIKGMVPTEFIATLGQGGGKNRRNITNL